MANPTRLQIEASIPLPKYKVEIWYANAWRQIPDSSIINISGDIQSTGNIDNGLSFGTEVEPHATIVCERLVVASADKLLEDSYWLLKRMRISYGFDTSDYVKTFVGPIRERSINQNELTVELVGNIEYVRNTKFYSSLYYAKPIATKTTIASVENPSSPSYEAGLINRIFWEAGGRPYEQEGINYAETDASFKFWYSCEQSILTPDWSWISSENLVDELYTLARAGGGQIYQDHNGVLKYVQPFSFADLSPYGGLLYTPYQYDDVDFQTYSEQTTSYEQVGTVKCTFTPRSVQPYQPIYEDKIPRFFQASEVKSLILETQLPVQSYQEIVSACFTATDIHGNAVTPTVSAVTTNATRIDVTLTNPSATTPMIIHSIKILGRPLGAGEEMTVSYGSGDPERNIENNTYIQSEPYAKRLIRMVYDFYASGRPVITLHNAIYDTDRFVGELVKVTSYYNRVYVASGVYNDNDDLYRIINIQHSLTGTTMNIDLVNVEGLPTRDQMFIIATTYSGSDTRKLSY